MGWLSGIVLIAVACAVAEVATATGAVFSGLAPSWDAIPMALMVPALLTMTMFMASGIVLWLTRDSRSPRQRRPRVRERRQLLLDEADHGPPALPEPVDDYASAASDLEEPDGDALPADQTTVASPR